MLVLQILAGIQALLLILVLLRQGQIGNMVADLSNQLQSSLRPAESEEAMNYRIRAEMYEGVQSKDQSSGK